MRSNWTKVNSVANLQLSHLCVKSAFQTTTNTSGSYDQNSLRSRELIMKCSELPAVVMGMTPLVRCPPVKKRRFSDWECSTMFSLGSDTGQCVPQNVCSRDI